MANLRSITKRVFLYPPAFIFSIIGTIVLGIIYVLQFIPCVLYKYLVFIVAKIVYSEAKMLSGADNILASGTVYKSKEWYITFNMIFEGRVELEKFSLELLDKVIKKRRADGKLQFPEWQYYVKNFMGYSFYILDEEFDMKNHIRVYDNKKQLVDKKQYHEIRREFNCKLHTKKRSPWEILIIHGYQPDKNSNNNSGHGKEFSVILFKVHHCLGDGNALISALFAPFGEIVPLSVPTFGGNTFTRFIAAVNSCFHFLVMTGRLPFYLIYKPRKVFDLNSWQKLIKKTDTQFLLWSPKPVETGLVKSISRANKVTVTSVLISVCAGAFRRLMEAKRFKTPRNIRVCLSHNLANSSDNKMTNNSGGTFFRMPMKSSGKLPSALLKKTNESMLNSLGVSYNILSYLYKSIIKFWPASFTCGSIRNSTPIATMGVSSFPLPSFDVQWAGCKLVETYSNIEFCNVSLALEVTILKYKHHFYVTFGIQQTLLPTGEVHEIEKYFNEELNSMKSSNNLVSVV